MKKHRHSHSFILSFLHFFILSFLHLSTVQAYDVELGGIFYCLLGSHRAYVTHADVVPDSDGKYAKEYSGTVVVPSQIRYNGRNYTVMSIGPNAFAGCEKLNVVRLPSTIQALSACAFIGCSNLRQVVLPADLQAISSCAFTGCTSLQQVSLPRHAEVVDTLTFYCCTSLTSVILPHTVRAVCQGAFEHLLSLKHLYCFSSIPPVAERGAFTYADQQNCTLHVPAEAVQLYHESPFWKDFKSIVPLQNGDYTGQGYQRGDINDDGRIDANDLALLRQLIVGQPDEAYVRWAADVNADGIVNAIDFVILSKR